MRISIFILLINCAFCSTIASQVRLGLKAGINTVDIDKDQVELFDEDGRKQLGIAIQDANYGINIGLYLLAKSERLFIQPELIYNSNSTDFTLDTLNSVGGFGKRVFNEKYQNLDIPILVGFRFDFFRIGAGPVGHIHLNHASDIVDFDGYEQDFKSLTLGYQAGIGIDLWAINFDLRYEGNFTRYGNHFRFFGDEVPFSTKPARFLATVGISF